MVHVAFDLPDNMADVVPWDDSLRHITERLALEGDQEGWLSEEQVRRSRALSARRPIHGVSSGRKSSSSTWASAHGQASGRVARERPVSLAASRRARG
jgi:hypothetical protein